MAVVNQFISSDVSDAREALGVFKKINSVLSVAPINEGIDASLLPAIQDDGGLDARLEQMCKEMDAARESKDWAKSDSIRNEIHAMGYETRQNP